MNDENVSQTLSIQACCQLSCLFVVSANREIRRAAAGHLVRRAVESCENLANPPHRREQFFRRRFQAIEKAAGDLAEISLLQSPDKLFGEPSRFVFFIGSRTSPKRFGGRDAPDRLEDDEIHPWIASDRFDQFSTSMTDGHSVDEKQRHVASKRRTNGFHFLRGKLQLPSGVREPDRHGRVARTAPHARPARNPFDQPDATARRNAVLLPDLFHGLDDDVVPVEGNVAHILS